MGVPFPILDFEVVHSLDGPVASGKFRLVQEGGFEVLDLIKGVNTVRDGDF